MAEKFDAKTFALVKSAVANDATIQIAAGKNALARYLPYVQAYGKATEEQRDKLWAMGSEILNAARDKVVQHLKAQHDPNFSDVAEISDVRTAEFRRIMAFGAYKCSGVVLGYFKDHVMNFDDVLAVAKFCTTEKPKAGERNGKAKPFDVAAPSKLQCLQAIKQRRADKRGNGNGSGEPRAKDATKAFDAGKPLLAGFVLWLKANKKLNDDAKKQIGVIKTALAELQSIARA